MTSFFDNEKFKPNPESTQEEFQIWLREFPEIDPQDVICEGELSTSDDPEDLSKTGHYVLTKKHLYYFRVSQITKGQNRKK